MAAINTMAFQRFLALPYANYTLSKSTPFLTLPISSYIKIVVITVAGSRNHRPPAAAVAMTDGIDVLPVKSEDPTDQQGGVAPPCREEESGLDQLGPSTSHIGGFAFDSGAGVGGGGGVGIGVGFSLTSSTSFSPMQGEDQDKMVRWLIGPSMPPSYLQPAPSPSRSCSLSTWITGMAGLYMR